MTQESLREYLKKNKDYISFRALANEIEMDVSNFHKFVKGDINIKPELLPKLTKIIKKLCPKEK